MPTSTTGEASTASDPLASVRQAIESATRCPLAAH